MNSKYWSRTWVFSVVMYVTGTVLAFLGQLTWEWISMSSIAFVGFGFIKTLNRNIISKLDKDDVKDVILGKRKESDNE